MTQDPHFIMGPLKKKKKARKKKSVVQYQTSETLVDFFGSSENELLAECFLKGIVRGIYCFILFYVNFCGAAKG